MAKLAATAGFGATLGYDLAAGSSYTVLANVLEITGPSQSREIIDVSHLSNADSTRTKIAGIIDPGTITLSCIMQADAASHDVTNGALSAFYAAPNTVASRPTWQLTVNDSVAGTDAKMEFAAIIQNFNQTGLTLTGAWTFELTLAISGKVTLTEGT